MPENSKAVDRELTDNKGKNKLNQTITSYRCYRSAMAMS